MVISLDNRSISSMVVAATRMARAISTDARPAGAGGFVPDGAAAAGGASAGSSRRGLDRSFPTRSTSAIPGVGGRDICNRPRQFHGIVFRYF
jgi:hypothetical protein